MGEVPLLATSQGQSGRASARRGGEIIRLTSTYVRLSRCTAATHRLPSNLTCQTPLKTNKKTKKHTPEKKTHNKTDKTQPEMTLRPSCWKQVMAPVWAIRVLLHLPNTGTQMRRVLSAAAETSLSSRRSRRPTRSEWPSSVCRQAPVSRSQILTSESMAPEMQRLRLWSSTTLYTFWLWPWRTCSCSPVLMRHTRTVLLLLLVLCV